ncbi:hypothetical protein [Streptomyces sp. NPDC005865]|uniref:hypothetical protein n=1 Tax=Streptomyces sp. NPDC005865 TaxID=3155453 RepID=UPI0033D36A94
MEWSNRCDHLRGVTCDDVLGHLSTVHGSQRKHTLVALRSLFTRVKKNGTIFIADPLHLALAFGVDEKTAIRYADSARALLHEAVERSSQ